MLRLILKRLAIGLLTMFAASIIVFLGTKVLPGDAAQLRLGQAATAENIAAMREKLGLDQPLIMQYFTWLFNFLQGDFGRSLSGDTQVVDLIADRYNNTLSVALLAMCIGVPISVALGILAAMLPGSVFDRVLTLVCVTLVASPEFFSATVLVLFFVLWLDIGSAVVVGSTAGLGLWGLLSHFALPVTVLCLVIASQLIRMTRSSLLNVMSSPYIEMAILKGLPRRDIILRHALRNAIGPIANIIALNVAYLLTGVIVVEIFFAYSGLATLIVQGVQTRDYVVVQSLGMIFCAIYVVLMLIADIAAIVSNPRLRHPK